MLGTWLSSCPLIEMGKENLKVGEDRFLIFFEFHIYRSSLCYMEGKR